MKIHITKLLPVLAICFAFAACGDEEVTDSKSNPVVLMGLNGKSSVEVQYGTTYKDAGCSATFMGKDYSDNIVVEGLDDIDTNDPGTYSITYACKAPDGFVYSAERTVVVCNPQVKYSAAGTFSTQAGTKRVAADGTEKTFTRSLVTVTKVASGLFSVNDLLGGFYAAMEAAGTPVDNPVTISALLLMEKDGTFKPYSVKANRKPATLDAFTDAKYNVDKGEFTWTITYKGDTYNIVMKK